MDTNTQLAAAQKLLAETEHRNVDATRSAKQQLERMCQAYKTADNGLTRYTILDELNRDVCIARTLVETVAQNNKIALEMARNNVAMLQTRVIQQQ
jgi:hypothetical protein